MRYLGLDLGRARIGLALADDVLRTARPHSTVHRRGDAVALAPIAAVARGVAFLIGYSSLPEPVLDEVAARIGAALREAP